MKSLTAAACLSLALVLLLASTPLSHASAPDENNRRGRGRLRRVAPGRRAGDWLAGFLQFHCTLQLALTSAVQEF
jgi:hypothetical protein